MNLKLNFDYTLMAYYRNDDSGGYVLVCKHKASKNENRPQYISYYTDPEGNCVWGRYDAGQTAVEAHKLFEARCNGDIA